eukprot:1510139-Prymnesium_polylepis.1
MTGKLLATNANSATACATRSKPSFVQNVCPLGKFGSHKEHRAGIQTPVKWGDKQALKRTARIRMFAAYWVTTGPFEIDC